MEHLWAPWRIQYVAGEKTEGCPLCEAHECAEDEVQHLIYRGRHNYVILNRFPYNSGHVMVVPYAHQHDFTALEPETLAEMMALAQGMVEAYAACLHPDGVNLGMNLGRAGGAGIAEHLHLHLVPRWVGDTNYITTVGETRVVPQALGETAALLAAALAEVMARR